jgi:hypothetical protein
MDDEARRAFDRKLAELENLKELPPPPFETLEGQRAWRIIMLRRMIHLALRAGDESRDWREWLQAALSGDEKLDEDERARWASLGLLNMEVMGNG